MRGEEVGGGEEEEVREKKRRGERGKIQREGAYHETHSPIAHTSTGGPYCVSPTSSSGERYHLVATYSVYSPPGPAESGGGGGQNEGEKEGQGKERGEEKERKEGHRRGEGKRRKDKVLYSGKLLREKLS